MGTIYAPQLRRKGYIQHKLVEINKLKELVLIKSQILFVVWNSSTTMSTEIERSQKLEIQINHCRH